MSIFAAKKLFDITTRQALYIEQVKLGETQQFAAALMEIEEEFKKLLGRLKYDNLDSLTKAQLNIFLKDLRVSQTRVYTRYQKKLINRLEQFMQVTAVQTMRLSASVYAHTVGSDPVKLLSESESRRVVAQAIKENKTAGIFGFAVLAGTQAAYSSLWSKIRNAPMPSGGALPINYVNVALATAMVNVESAVRKAWVNKNSTAELKAEILGGTLRNTTSAGAKTEEIVTGVLPKTNNTMRAVLATTMQHIAQQSSGAVNSNVWAEYVWVSVIDSVTSGICRSRNRKKYKYGKGPLPPAHPHCRSHTVPFAYYEADFEMPTFYEWLKVQPEGFISSVFGSTIAAKFKNGTVSRSDFEKFNPSTSKTIEDFKNGIDDLI